MSFENHELPFDPEKILSGLKDFQRESVDCAFERLYGDQQADRFLIADEVGLGKTMIARGITARAVEHLWESEDPEHRIDVVYICSNRAIADQNIRRLDISGSGSSLASRMTLIANQVENLRSRKLNFISFTPNTSFDLKSGMGMAKERILIWSLLRREFGADLFDQPGMRRLFQGYVTTLERFDEYARHAPTWLNVDEELTTAFAAEVKAKGLLTRLEAASEAWRDAQMWGEEGQPQRVLVAELRKMLAGHCVASLEPDLIILDEFQRFRSLLSKGSDEDESTNASEASELAHQLFEFPGAKTLLLSATPYKMFTNVAEDESHHSDFIQTVNFLNNSMGGSFETVLTRYQNCVRDLSTIPRYELAAAREALETELRRVMSRTERLAVSDDRNGMLREVLQTGESLCADDIRTFVELDKLGQHLNSAQMVDYWKSAPCFLNFTDGYKLDGQLDHALAELEGRDETAALVANVGGQVDWEKWRTYDELAVANVSYRNLVSDTTGAGMWKMLWLAPSLPYYQLEGPWADPELASVTKRLIFSKWAATPKAIASLLSYDAERRIMGPAGAEILNTAEARKRLPTLLTFKRRHGEVASMTTWSLVYPSWTLAEAGDPLAIAREHGGGLSVAAVRTIVTARIEVLLDGMEAGDSAREDQRWYWAAPLLFDAAADRSEWMSTKRRSIGFVAGCFSMDSDDEAEEGPSDGVEPDVDGRTTALEDHVALAMQVYTDGLDLGRMPADLAATLAEAALSAPGNAALRALSRLTDDASIEPLEFWGAACTIASGFQSLFNQPEAIEIVKSQTGDSFYWRSVLQYSTAGGLNSVIDEFAHVSREWLGVVDVGPGDLAPIAGSIAEALSVRDASYTAKDHLELSGSSKQRLRSHFALRFGDEKSETDSTVIRSGHLRTAFNSPFWPFVLASTSVGQEGLDFHLYCHAITHWNLPHNPVDLEQREGRVHRFKGHAVRRNVADAFDHVAFNSTGDPWIAMFDAASAARQDHENDLVPYWIYPGKYFIERRVEALPMSREVQRLTKLKKAVAQYRLVFGQPRQDDLLEYLSGIEDQSLLDELKIDLSPRLERSRNPEQFGGGKS